LRWVAKALGFDRITLKANVLRCYFHKNAQSAYYESPLFDRLVRHLSANGKVLGITLKQTQARLLLIKEKVHTLRKAREFLVTLQAQTSSETT
jgi:transcription-repair coupling factor (superfamily II helicase)